ncbi:hypothetical protein LTR27_009472 [Elasticomyces elasticus]|nr:hypothetical protein LTR27_009472 [Elasticomyces elasticus]
MWEVSIRSFRRRSQLLVTLLLPSAEVAWVLVETAATKCLLLGMLRLMTFVSLGCRQAINRVQSSDHDGLSVQTEAKLQAGTEFELLPHFYSAPRTPTSQYQTIATMSGDGDAGWQVVGPKKPRKFYRFLTPAEAWMYEETEKPTEDKEATAYTGKFAGLETPPEVFPFFDLPAELREEVYGLLVTEYMDIFYNNQAGYAAYNMSTLGSRRTAQSRFLGYALTSMQVHQELQAVDIRTRDWTFDADTCLNGPSTYLPDSEAEHQIQEGLRMWTVRGKLQGKVQYSGTADYSCRISLDRKYKGGYLTVWSKLNAQARSATNLRADGAEYEETQRLVEYLIEETVAERRARDGCCRLTWEGAARIIDAFGIVEEA